MKSVIRSAKSYWIYLILTGKKTVEVGKDFPKSADWNKVVEMYCSKDMRSFNRIPEKDREWMREYLGKVACRFVCDMIEEYPFDWTSFTAWGNKHFTISEKALKATCLSRRELDDYGNSSEYKKQEKLYGWHISDFKIYDTPKELGEFHTPCKLFKKRICGTRTLCGERKGICDGTQPLTRPFQSWGYVEEL